MLHWKISFFNKMVLEHKKFRRGCFDDDVKASAKVFLVLKFFNSL